MASVGPHTTRPGPTTSTMPEFPLVTPGASLLTAWRPSPVSRSTALIVGSAALASSRAFSCLESGYKVVIYCGRGDEVDEELVWREKEGELKVEEADGGDLAAFLDARPALLASIALVFVTDTLRVTAKAARSTLSATELRQVCYDRRLPVNVADHPSLSDFSVPTSHRIPLLDGTPSPLQVALTTNASACRLASRLRRLLVAAMPKGAGSAVKRVAELREAIRAADLPEESCEEVWNLLESVNAPVEQMGKSRCTSPRRGRSRPPLLSMASAPARTTLTDPLDTPPTTPSFGASGDALIGDRMTRMRFIAQICAFRLNIKRLS